jgi:two-component system alkaline phosphatase synthesis response regulator PhoP
MLPGMDGLDVLTRLRHESNVYVILLTAKTEETDKIIGLSIGADDYLTKPFSPRELTARVKSALRRLQKDELQNPESEVLKFKQIIIDVDAHRVLVNGISIQLTATEFTILLLLARNRGRVLTREQILESLWGYGFIGDTRVIDVHLGHIRQKIGDGLISTVRGLGYLFEDEAV